MRKINTQSNLLAFEKLERKSNQDNIKTSLKQEDCLKFLSCCIDRSILQLFQGTEQTILQKLSAESKLNYEVRHFNWPIVRWERKVVKNFPNTDTMSVEKKQHETV